MIILEFWIYDPFGDSEKKDFVLKFENETDLLFKVAELREMYGAMLTIVNCYEVKRYIKL